MVNKVMLIGHLAADPEVRALPSGVHVANMRVATNTYAGKDDAGVRREFTEFHSVVAFGQSAEFAGEYLRKGALVYVEGRSQTRSWETGEGLRRYLTEVLVDNLKALSPRLAEAS